VEIFTTIGGNIMDAPEKTVKNIFELIPAITMTFIKPFEQKNNFPELGKSHIRALIYLKLDGPTIMSKLSSRIELEKGSFTCVAKYLIDNGLVQSMRPESDKRRTMLSLTEKGDTMAVSLMTEHRYFIMNQINKLGSKEKDEFTTALETVLTHIRNM
jgi:DNA-binding MarR family transcriptional regulator